MAIPWRLASAMARGSGAWPACQPPVPAESTCTASPACSAACSNAACAKGERQILPRHTNKTEGDDRVITAAFSHESGGEKPLWSNWTSNNRASNNEALRPCADARLRHRHTVCRAWAWRALRSQQDSLRSILFLHYNSILPVDNYFSTKRQLYQTSRGPTRGPAAPTPRIANLGQLRAAATFSPAHNRARQTRVFRPRQQVLPPCLTPFCPPAPAYERHLVCAGRLLFGWHGRA
jgi:hypothetical protein